MRETRILLDNIRSVHNVGSIFRTAECAGVTKIYCIGTTPVPIDRFGRKRKDFAKVSLGAEDLVGWEYMDDEEAIKTIKQLKKKERFKIVAIEQCKNSIDIYEFKPGQKTLLILGNEVDGVSRGLLKVADVSIEIPMKGKKESLNVSVAAGVVLFSRH
jgi:tRNA G18 (ribose-2'-O)-methylase SpoU